MLMEYDYSKIIEVAKVIDTAIDGLDNPMSLYEIDTGEDEKSLFYEAIDPSKNEKIVLRVHPDCKTCNEAKIRTFKILRDSKDTFTSFTKES
jgi:hypothetical protein